MNHLVLIDFVCKESDVYYASGSFFSSTKIDRVRELEEKGFIKTYEELNTLEKQEVKRTRKKASD